MRMIQGSHRSLKCDFGHPLLIEKDEYTMKKLFIISAMLALTTICSRAQYAKSWTFEDWETATFSADVTVDGLAAHATSEYFVAVEENKKSIEIDGAKVNFTKRLNLKGVEQAMGRYVSFDVTGPCEIIIAYSGAANAPENRILNVSYGATHNMNNLLSVVVPMGGAITQAHVKYELDEPTTIHIGSGNSGAYLFGIYVKQITLNNPEPSTPKLTWDFVNGLSERDKANIEADNVDWTQPDAEGSPYRYSYALTYEVGKAVFYSVELSANGQMIDMTKGLRFGRINGALDKDRFRIDQGRCLGIVGSDIGFIIPDLKRNDKIKIRFSSNSNGTARTLKLTNAYTTDNCTSSQNGNSNASEVTCTVLSDGYVGFRGDNSWNCYSITVNEDMEQPAAYQLTTEDTDYYSLYLDYDAIIPEGITAYTAALSEDRKAVELTQVTGTVLKRNCGYIVKGNAAGTFGFEVSGIMGGEIEGNELKGVTVNTGAADIEAANPGKTVIMLGLKDGVMGFRRPAAGTVEANKAYLLTDTPPAPNQIISIKDGGNTTVICQVTTGGGDRNAPAFNLSGQRVGRNFKGIVLIDGRKVIRK